MSALVNPLVAFPKEGSAWGLDYTFEGPSPFQGPSSLPPTKAVSPSFVPWRQRRPWIPSPRVGTKPERLLPSRERMSGSADWSDSSPGGWNSQPRSDACEPRLLYTPFTSQPENPLG